MKNLVTPIQPDKIAKNFGMKSFPVRSPQEKLLFLDTANKIIRKYRDSHIRNVSSRKLGDPYYTYHKIRDVFGELAVSYKDDECRILSLQYEVQSAEYWSTGISFLQKLSTVEPKTVEVLIQILKRFLTYGIGFNRNTEYHFELLEERAEEEQPLDAEERYEIENMEIGEDWYVRIVRDEKQPIKSVIRKAKKLNCDESTKKAILSVLLIMEDFTDRDYLEEIDEITREFARLNSNQYYINDSVEDCTGPLDVYNIGWCSHEIFAERDLEGINEMSGNYGYITPLFAIDLLNDEYIPDHETKRWLVSLSTMMQEFYDISTHYYKTLKKQDET